MLKENSKQTLEYHLYIKKDYKTSLNILQEVFTSFLNSSISTKKMNSKHKCNRNEDCECIPLGKMLIDIYINTEKKTNLTKLLENYFYNPGFNLPFSLFKYLCKNMIKLLDFQNANTLIENYLMYSKIKSGNDNRVSSGYEIDLRQYEELNEILIFEVILIMGGFNRAKSKIMTLLDEKIKSKFLFRYFNLLEAFTKEKDQTLMTKLICENDENDLKNLTNKYDPNLYSKINQIVDDKMIKNFKFRELFSKFQIKNSFLQKIIFLILSKKFLLFALTTILMIILRKLIKSHQIDKKLLNLLAELAVYLNKFKFFYAIRSFLIGFFKLLVNY